MGRLKRWMTTLGVLVLLTGCASVPETGEPQPAEIRAPLPTDGSLKTDSDTYTASCQGEGNGEACTVNLVVIYINQTDAPVYLNHTTGANATLVYSVRGLSEADSAYNPNWAGCCAERLEILPGQARQDTSTLTGPYNFDGDEPLGDLEGRIQLLYEVFNCPDEGTVCLLPNSAVSNVFTVTLPD